MCVRAIGDKATAATQVIITNASLVQIDPTTRAVVSNGCTATLSRVKVSGTVEAVGGGGNCPAGIAD